MKITIAQLKKLKACDDQVELFKATFGASAEVTLENCLIAAKVELDFDWAARNLLNPAQKAAYEAAKAQARAAYEAAEAPVRAAYEAAEASARAAYAAAEAPSRAAYKAAKAPAWAAYEAVKASAWAAYEDAKARAFFKALREE